MRTAATTVNETRIHAEHDRVLELLRDAASTPLSIAALHDAGVSRPATVIYELGLSGHLIRRIGRHPAGTGFRLEGAADAAGLVWPGADADADALEREHPRP